MRPIRAFRLLLWLLCMVCSTAARAACPEGSLFETATRTPVLFDDPLTDGVVGEAGGRWDGRHSLVLAGEDRVAWSWPEPVRIRGLYVQADNDDAYVIEVSTDGGAYRPIWTAVPRPRDGLRARATADLDVEATSLRIRPAEGDGRYAVSEVVAVCQIPDPWPPAFRVGAGWTPSRAVSLAWLKIGWGVIGGATCLWLLARRRRLGGVLASTIVLVSAFVWTNAWTFHGDRAVHVHDSFHYVLGARYFAGLGYDDLYGCTLDSLSDERWDVEQTRVRDLETNTIIPGRRALAMKPCRGLRGSARYQLDADVRAFRQKMGDSMMERVLLDHGYNASPVWTALMRPVIGRSPTTQTHMWLLTQIDTVGMLLVFALLGWAFGAPTAASASVVWAVGYPWAYFWTGGSVGRTLWLVAAVGALACWRRGRPRTAGALLGLSIGLRVTPLLLLIGPLIATVPAWWRGEALDRADRRAATGLITSLAVLFLATTASLGTGVWAAFVRNTLVHMDTPLTNHMGLTTLIASDPWTLARDLRDSSLLDPFEAWKEARRNILAARWPLRWLGAAGALGLLGWWVRRVKGRDLHAAAGVIALIGLLQLTSYDYIFLLLLAPLVDRPSRAAWWFATAVGTQLAQLSSTWMDEQYLAATVVVIVGVVGLLVQVGREVSAERGVSS